VLKNPSPLFALDALMAAYPDALVVQCHRPVETIMASMCSLAQHTTEGWSNVFTGEVIGQDSLETWSRGLELFDTERAKHDPAQFYDLDYFEFIKDPIATVQNVYQTFGIEFTDAARDAMTSMHAESQKGPRAPKHTYSLADYGLTDDQVRSVGPVTAGLTPSYWPVSQFVSTHPGPTTARRNRRRRHTSQSRSPRCAATKALSQAQSSPLKDHSTMSGEPELRWGRR
jgi:hypothetical protein